MNRSIRTKASFCFFLSVLTITVYWGVLRNGFLNYDDFQYVTNNRHVTSGISMENVVWAFTSGYAANWHPITWLSHMLDVELFGMDPRGHHLVNLLFHSANTCLLFLILTRITGTVWRSLLVATLFAVHPLHVESVAWIAERKDVLSTFFGMLAIIAYSWYVRKRTAWPYLVLCGCFLLSLMSKPMMVTLPFVMLLLDYWPLQRFGTRDADIPVEQRQAGKKLPFSRLIIEKLPLFIFAVLSCYITISVQKVEAMHTLQVTPLSFRIGNALVAYLSYLGKTVWPHDLAVLYPLPKTIPLLESSGAGLLLLLISYAVYALSHKRAYLLVGWLWFLGTLVPVIGIVQVGLQSMADRYTYFPSIGIYIMSVWGISELAIRWPSWRVPLAVAAGGIIVMYSFITWRYEQSWVDSTALFSHAIDVTADNYYAHYMLGNALYEENRFEDALDQFAIVRQLEPRFADAYTNMGIIYAKMGQPTEAIKYFTTALSLKPESKDVHYNIAVALQAQGKAEEAIAHYNEVLRLDPENVGAHYNLGIVLMGLERWDEAISHFAEAVRLKPGFEDARRGLQWCIQKKAGT
ncbi:tetratricopeptide repeat protein [Geobacter sp. AOG2]|uniref:tetratricopeptide repeat protein n=1 Tax=Geobacter sp. AOG2 TaxID=1566347 RepID=UPI001CC38EC5|nr:tetratricopeptide repeat protein [Geobacter sp. AOG2]